MDVVTLEMHDSVAAVRLQRGVSNAINLALVSELSSLLSEAARDRQVHGLVLTSSNSKFFSIGFDLPELYDLSPQDFKVFYQAFNRLCLELYSWPKPTLAALPGHAIAGGCILAMCCDGRIIAPGRKLMGLNEIKLGVPVPYPADRILQEIVGGRNASTIMEGGEFYPPDEALALGLVDQILPAEELETAAMEKVRGIGALSPQAFALIKRNRVEPVTDRITQVLDEKEKNFMESWFSPEARALVAEARKNF